LDLQQWLFGSMHTGLCHRALQAGAFYRPTRFVYDTDGNDGIGLGAYVSHSTYLRLKIAQTWPSFCTVFGMDKFL
jgi:hypothetical protein